MSLSNAIVPGLEAAGRARRSVLPLVAAVLLSACVVVPQTREVYDPRCKVMTQEVVLETAVLGQFGSCQGRDCTALLVSFGLVTAASAVVSGSVAVVGNAVHWFERQGRCPGDNASASPTLAAPAVPLAAPAD